MYKSILVPIDLSHEKVAKAIMDRAVALADKGAKITLLHVLGSIPNYAETYLPDGQLQANLDDAREVLAGMAKTINADAIVRYGNPSPIILEEAETLGVDLVIIGSHHPGLVDYLIGSTASRVVRHADCSVLVVR